MYCYDKKFKGAEMMMLLDCAMELERCKEILKENGHLDNRRKTAFDIACELICKKHNENITVKSVIDSKEKTKKATIFTTDGNEIECEYEWIEETYTTLSFFASDSTYTKFSKFNVIMWCVAENK